MELRREVDLRLRKKYLDRLSTRVRKLRKLLVDREWEELRRECRQIATTSGGFGFATLASLALLAEESIPMGNVPRATVLPHARRAIEVLISTIDHTLTESALERDH